MRDLSRFLRVYQRASSSSQQVTLLQAILYAFNSTYLMKEGVTDAKREQALHKIRDAFNEQVELADQETTVSLT